MGTIKKLVLDHADELLDRGFKDQIDHGLLAMPPRCFSCTLTATCSTWWTHFKRDPVQIKVKRKELEGVKQLFLDVGEREDWKLDALCEMLIGLHM